MKRPGPSSGRGFTLVEMLVAIAAMAVIAGFAWRGLNAMSATREGVVRHDRAIERADLALAQWDADLAALQRTGIVPAVDYDGRVLRLTRTLPGAGAADPGLQVVAWALADGQWRRWASTPVSSVAALDLAWRQAADLAGGSTSLSPPALAMLPLARWQVFFHRNDAWIDARLRGTSVAQDPPEGIRLEILVSQPPLAAGVVRRDWVRPTAPAGGVW